MNPSSSAQLYALPCSRIRFKARIHEVGIKDAKFCIHKKSVYEEGLVESALAFYRIGRGDVAKVTHKSEEAIQVIEQWSHLTVKSKSSFDQYPVSPIGMLKAPGSTADNYSKSYYDHRRYGTDDELCNFKRAPEWYCH